MITHTYSVRLSLVSTTCTKKKFHQDTLCPSNLFWSGEFLLCRINLHYIEVLLMIFLLYILIAVYWDVTEMLAHYLELLHHTVERYRITTPD